ncbi:MAG: J domain-containing protein [Halolamina sp.]
MPRDFYDVLGVDEDADSEELNQAYRDRAREYHPDLNDGERATWMFTLVNRANDVLSDPAERAAYDRLGHDEYVAKRMNGLPSMSFDEEDDENIGIDAEPDADGATTSGRSGPGSESEAESSTATGRSSARSTESTGSTSTTGSDSASGSASSSNASTSSGSAAGSNRSGASTSSTRSDSSTASSASDATSGSSRSGTTGADASASVANATTGSTGESSTGGGSATSSSVGHGAPTGGTTGSGAATRSVASARRRGLRRAYAALLVVAATYAVGLAAYAGHVAPTLSRTASGLLSEPTATLTVGSPLPSALAVVREAATTLAAGTVAVEAATTLAFAVGAAALPAVLLGTVARYGRGTAWAYSLPSLGPLVAVGAVAASVAPATTGLHLAGFVLAPAIATAAFLVDVGVYLYATR